jgi:DNA polymerase-3 subunit alpha
VIGGIIVSVKNMRTKKGDAMAFVKLEDLEGVCRLVVFPNTFEKSKELLAPDEIIFVRGRADTRQEEASVVVSDVIPIRNVHQELAGSVTVKVPSSMLNEETFYNLKDIFAAHPGSCPVFVEVKTAGNRLVALRVGSENHVAPSARLARDVQDLLGEDHLVFTPHGDGKKRQTAST